MTFILYNFIGDILSPDQKSESVPRSRLPHDCGGHELRHTLVKNNFGKDTSWLEFEELTPTSQQQTPNRIRTLRPGAL